MLTEVEKWNMIMWKWKDKRMSGRGFTNITPLPKLSLWKSNFTHCPCTVYHYLYRQFLSRIGKRTHTDTYFTHKLRINMSPTTSAEQSRLRKHAACILILSGFYMACIWQLWQNCHINNCMWYGVSNGFYKQKVIGSVLIRTGKWCLFSS